MAEIRLSADTKVDIERLQVEGWRRMSAEQKAAIVTGLTQAAYDLPRGGVKQRFPHAAPRQQFLRLAVATLGVDLARGALPGIDDLDLS